MRVRLRQVDVVILAVVREDGRGEDVCGDEWQAVVRKEDVRATEKEKVVCGEGFRAGDVVRGVVVSAFLTLRGFRSGLYTRKQCHEDLMLLFKDPEDAWQGFLWLTVLQISLGDQSNYYLSTARNELGVIMAKSEAGNTMVPISWKEFRDPITGERESRKVAKPF